MRYIVDDNDYLTAVSFGADIECDGTACAEYTGPVPTGYANLEAWYIDNVDKLYMWCILRTSGSLFKNESRTPPAEDAIAQPPLFNNNVHVFAKDPSGVRTNVLEPNNSDGNTILGWGNYNEKKGDTMAFGYDVWVGVSNIATPNKFRPYYRRGESHNVNIYTAGLVTNAGKDVYFTVPTSKPIIGSPTVTAASVSGFILRQDGNYTHGSGASTYVKPDSYTCTVIGSSGVKIKATFNTTTNVTNNAPIAILWDGKVTFS